MLYVANGAKHTRSAHTRVELNDDMVVAYEGVDDDLVEHHVHNAYGVGDV